MKTMKGVKSNIKPVEIDDSDENTILVRSNIKEETVIDPVFKTETKMYTYDEDQYSYNEWYKRITFNINESTKSIQDEVNNTQLGLIEMLGLMYQPTTLSLDNDEDMDFMTLDGEASKPKELDSQSVFIKIYANLIKQNLLTLDSVAPIYLEEVKKYLEENK